MHHYGRSKERRTKKRAARQEKKDGEGDDGPTKPTKPTGLSSPRTPNSTGKEKPKPSLEDIISTIATLSETIKSGFAEQKVDNNDLAVRLSDSVVMWERVADKVSQHEALSVKTQRRLRLQEIRMQTLERKIEEQERESRRKFLLIEGVPEEKHEKVTDIVDDLFDSLEVGFGSDRCDRAQRRGKLTAPPNKTTKPRLIIISFIRVSDKAPIFQGLKNLKGKEKWAGVSIGDDLTDLQRNQVRDLPALNAYAKSKGYNTAVKGNLFILDRTKYRSEDLYQLPEELSLRKAKTLEIDGGKGLAFQGHHSPLSNMYRCHVLYDGHNFESLEVAYQYARAKICNCKREAEALVDISCGYKAKSISYGIKDTKEWLNCRVKVMTDLVRFKFQQNEDCKQCSLSQVPKDFTKQQQTLSGA